MPGDRFVYVTYIRTTPEALWQALIDPAFTRRYWCETWQESTWQPGAAWRIMGPPNRVCDTGEVIEIDPPRRLVVTWQNHMFADMQAEGHSRLTYELEPQSDSVKLTLTHEIDVSPSKLIAATSQGWPPILASLKSLLETGEPLEITRRWPEGI
jgi:uncharacterized protein YndB with AHSA1/START domain